MEGSHAQFRPRVVLRAACISWYFVCCLEHSAVVWTYSRQMMWSSDGDVKLLIQDLVQITHVYMHQLAGGQPEWS